MDIDFFVPGICSRAVDFFFVAPVYIFLSFFFLFGSFQRM